MNTNRDRVAVARGDGWKHFIEGVPPVHQEPVGTVKVGSSLEGALIYDNDTDQFFMIDKQGKAWELNQRKVRAALGLAVHDDPLAKPVGKPRAGYEVRELHSIRLEPSDAEYLRQAGGGNLSEGIRKITRERREREQPK